MTAVGVCAQVVCICRVELGFRVSEPRLLPGTPGPSPLCPGSLELLLASTLWSLQREAHQCSLVGALCSLVGVLRNLAFWLDVGRSAAGALRSLKPKSKSFGGVLSIQASPSPPWLSCLQQHAYARQKDAL